MATLKELVIKIKAQTEGLQRDLAASKKKLSELGGEAKKAAEKADKLSQSAELAADKAKVLKKEAELAAEKIIKMGGGSEQAQLKVDKLKVAAETAAVKAQSLAKAASQAKVEAVTLAAKAAPATTSVAAGFDKVAMATQHARVGVTALKVAMIGFLGGALLELVNKLASLPGIITSAAESFNQLSAKIGNSLQNAMEFPKVMEEIRNAANRSGGSLEAFGQAFVRLSSASAVIKVNNDQIIRFIELFNKLGAVSGVTGEELKNTMIQVSQGIASGKLQGDELKTVLESMPRLTDAIARAVQDEMGGSFKEARQSIKELAKDGQLAPELVLNALLGMSSQIESEFAKLPASTERSTTEMQNQWFELFGVMNEAIPITNLISKAFNALSVIIQQATKWVKQHDTVLRALANTALEAANFVYYGVSSIINTIVGLAAGAVGAILTPINVLLSAFAKIGGLKIPLLSEGLLKFAGGRFKAVANDVKLLGRNLDITRFKFEKLGGTIKNVGTLDSPGILAGDGDGKGKKGKKGRKEKEYDPDKIRGLGSTAMRTFAMDMADYWKAYNKTVDISLKGVSSSFKDANAIIKREQQEVASLLKGIETPLDKYAESYAKATEYMDKGWLSQKQYNDLLADAKDNLFPELKTKLDEYNDTLKLINEALLQNIINEDEATTLRKKALDDLNENGQKMKEAFSGYLNDIGRKFEDTFIESIKNGKFNFRDFVSSALEDLGRLMLRLLVIEPIIKRVTTFMLGKKGDGSGGVVGFLGNLFNKGGSSAAPVPGKATGGDIMPRRPYLVGERGPELIFPSKTGRVMNNQGTRQVMGGQAVEPIIINQNFSVGVAQTVRAEMRNMRPEFVADALRALDKDVRRNGSMAKTVGRRA